MTDYLEELLKQQERESEDGVMEWRKRRVYGAEPRGMARDGRAAGQASVVLGEAELRPVRENARGMERLLQQTRRLHRAVRLVGERERGAAAAFPAEMPWETEARHGAALTARRTADYAAAVDAAFQRDARRYDGPMELPR